jgi:lysozyme
MNRARVGVAALAFSASGLITVAVWEGYTERAVIPVPGDVPTKGFGTTKNTKLGDITTPVRALIDLAADVSETERGLKTCIRAPLFQHEWDAYVSLAYNVGYPKVCNGSIPRLLSAGNYEAACRKILEYSCGPAREYERDPSCSTPNGPPKKRIKGLENRRKVEYNMCIGGNNATNKSR